MAKKIDGEIINADSIQIYKDLEILTARPKPKENDPNHHLYGFVNGDELWSVGKWINEAKKITQRLLKKIQHLLSLVEQVCILILLPRVLVKYLI